MKYIDVYSFQVIRELEKGNTVWILDKEKGTVTNAATMRAIDLLAVLQAAEVEGNERYYFWREEEQSND